MDREADNSMFVLGIVSPDLLSIFNPGLRIKAAQVDHLPEASDGSSEFVKGLHRHFDVDRAFHSSLRFQQEVHVISTMLQDYFPDREIHRKFFIAHILLELQLDQVLVRRYDTIVEEFYRHFENLRPFGNAQWITERISGHDLPSYDSFLEKFLQNRYLTHYREHDHIIYVLGRLLRRVKIEDTDFLATPAFERLMDDYHLRLDGFYKEFFQDLRMAGLG